MSQTHVRVRVPKTPVKRNYWVEAAIFAVAIVAGGYYVQSRILYRIEARVTYPVHGASQDRWMPASEISGDRNFLALQMAKQSGKCLVYWAPHHEENPRCLLQ